MHIIIKHSALICFLLFLSYSGAKAQNLVPNSSFENYNSCPSQPGDISIPSGIYDTVPAFTWVLNWFSPTIGSPDYFNSCSSNGGVGVPDNWVGHRTAHTRNAYAGFYVYNGSGSDGGEYVECELSHALNADHHYYTSFYLSLSENIAGTVPDQIGAYFSNSRIFLSDSPGVPPNTPPIYHPNLPYKASIKSPSHQFITDTLNWTKVSDIYTATGNEQWMILGRFSGDTLNVQVLNIGNWVNYEDYAYYYLDDVCVIDLDGVTGPDIHDTSICNDVFPAIISGRTDTFSDHKYLWNTGDTTASITVNDTGVYWRTTITISKCAAYVDTVIIGVPLINLRNNITICNQDTLTLSVPFPQRYYGYLWNTGDTTPSISITQPGTYIVTSYNNCGTLTDTFSVSTPVFLPSSGSKSSCPGQQNGEAWVQPRAGDTTTYTYTWTNTAGTIVQSATSSAVGDTLYNQASGTYTVTMYRPGGCDTSLPITINPIRFMPSSGSRSGCSGRQNGEAWVQPRVGDTTIYTYTWTDVFGDTLQPAITSSTIADTLYNQYAGTYTVNMQGTNGCDTTLYVIIAPPSDTSFLHASDTGICPHDTIAINVTGGVSYHWRPDNKTYISDTAIANPKVSPPTDWSYVVYGSNISGCLDTTTAYVRVYSNAVIQLPDSVILYYGESYQFNPGTNCLTFNWFPPQGLSADDISNPVASPEANTQYIVTGTTEEGCTVKEIVNVYRDNDVLLTLPNVFTPGNGPNNLLKPIYKGNIILDYLRIFNRWGQMVYESDNLNEGWDGTWHGAPQPQDVFIYTMQGHAATGRMISKQGNVTLLR